MDRNKIIAELYEASLHSDLQIYDDFVMLHIKKLCVVFWVADLLENYGEGFTINKYSDCDFYELTVHI